MPPTRTRWIVRRAVMVLAGCVVLPTVYVASCATMGFAVNSGIVPMPRPLGRIWNLYSGPLVVYMTSDSPGSRQCLNLITWCEKRGYERRMSDQ